MKTARAARVTTQAVLGRKGAEHVVLLLVEYGRSPRLEPPAPMVH